MSKPQKSLTEVEIKLVEGLRKHPELADRILAIVAMSEGKEGMILNANEIEVLLIEEVRKLGAAALHTWGQEAEKHVGDQFQSEHPGSYCGKKNV